ncbi:MAG: exo-alpha-sialidase [Alphaproteobacteria bacterium]|nr:exo-alpha-sialidase [Alphaproteobacteria bacterium]
MKRPAAIALGVAVLMTAAPTWAQHAGHGGGQKPPAVRPATCLQPDAQPSPLCAETPTAAFDADGRLWLTWAQDGHVYVAHAAGANTPFAAPARITPAPLELDINGENRPKAAVAPNGDVYVTFTAKGKKKFTGAVYFSRSLDGGKSFSAPRLVSDESDPGSQRFDIIKVGQDGRITIAWLDKRDLFAAQKAGQDYRGSALYYAVSDDRGATFKPNRLGAHYSCECCRVAMDFAPDGLPVMVWRHVFRPSFRDHAVMKLNADGTPGMMTRLSEDNWHIEACPHHGPSLSIAPDGTQHVTWFTDGDGRKGVFYARSDDGGKTFGAPMGFGSVDNQAQHPSVLQAGSQVHITWKEFSGTHDEVYVMTSADRGQTWSAPLRVAATVDASDHPFLITDGGWVYVSWGTSLEGWRLFKFAPVQGGRAE